MQDLKNIAVVAPNLLNGFTTQLLWSIQTESMNTDYDIVIYTTRAVAQLGGPLYLYERIASQKKADAVIIIAYPIDAGRVELFKNAGVKIVMIDGELPNGHWVGVDNIKGGYEGAKYLLDTGRKRIGIVAGETKFALSQRNRMQGVRQAFEEKNRKLEENMVMEIAEYDYQAGKDSLRYAIMNDADAVFCIAGDFVAQGLYNEARKQGVSMPHNLALVGYDDIVSSADLGLTTVKQPLEEMGKAAFKLAKRAIEEPGLAPQIIKFNPELIIRETA